MPLIKKGIKKKMSKLEQLMQLNALLLAEMPRYKPQALQFDQTYSAQRRLLRSLMNVRPPMPLDEGFLRLQDAFLGQEVREKGLVHLAQLPPTKKNSKLHLWQGDITTLAVDAIVNAANSALLGCFLPCHGCIDNAIHSMAGLQLRNECACIMQEQAHEEETGKAKITAGYNLPCRYVLHTVGPIITGELTQNDCDLLSSAYRECLTLAAEKHLHSVAFCCISTGEFRFPNQRAAEIAIETVTTFLSTTTSEIEVIFNVFKETDHQIYRNLLGEDCKN